MTQICRICLGDVPGDSFCHPKCAKSLFDQRHVPQLDIKTSKLHTAALAMVGHTSLSGVQKKISLNLSADRETLQVAAGRSRYILKPPTEAYPALPENEHVTMRLAQLAGIEVSPFGLISMEEGSIAYIARRFDRPPDGSKLRLEDFCQLSQLSPKEKYDSTSERCVRLVQKYTSEPGVEVLKLFRLLVFGWWSGNGDMHLKNFSLLIDTHGIIRLSPAYDLVCTRLVIPQDPLALPVCGKKDNLNRKIWIQFADYCQLSPKAANRVLDKLAQSLTAAQELIDRSFLPTDMKLAYRLLIAERTAMLQAA